MCPFDNTAFAVVGKVGIPYAGLTKPVRWLSILQPTVLSRSAIVVLSKCRWHFCVFTLLEFSVGVRAFVIGLCQISSLFF